MEIGGAENLGGDEVFGGAGLAVGLHDAEVEEAAEPGAEAGVFLDLEETAKLDGGEAAVLGDEAEGDAFAASQLELLVHAAEEIDQLWAEDASLHAYDNAILFFDDLGRRFGLAEEGFVYAVEAAALAFHQAQVVEELGEEVVAADGFLENIARGYSKGERSWIMDFEVFGVQVDENVTTGGIRPVNQGVGEKLADDDFVVVRDGFTKEAVGKFGGFAPVGNLSPNGLNQFGGVEGVVVPSALGYAFAAGVIFEELDYWGVEEAGAVLAASDP